MQPEADEEWRTTMPELPKILVRRVVLLVLFLIAAVALFWAHISWAQMAVAVLAVPVIVWFDWKWLKQHAPDLTWIGGKKR